MKLNSLLISVALKQNKIRARKLADKIGISEGYLSKILSGRRRPSALIVAKLARILNCDPRILIDCDWRPASKRNRQSKSAKLK